MKGFCTEFFQAHSVIYHLHDFLIRHEQLVNSDTTCTTGRIKHALSSSKAKGFPNERRFLGSDFVIGVVIVLSGSDRKRHTKPPLF